MNPQSRTPVAGARGVVGSAIVRRLLAGGYTNVLSPGLEQLDLLDQAAVRTYLQDACADHIFIAAAKVGGIQANNQCRAVFLYQNLQIEANLIHCAHLAGIQRLTFLASSCDYPRNCPQPIKEEYLLTGPLEPTKEPYAIAKIAGIKLAESYKQQYGSQYVSVMPTSLYRPNDNYDHATSHVLPALIHKAHIAKQLRDTEIVVWGGGPPRREFLYVDDLADARVHLAERDYDGPLLNIGTGEDLTIRGLAQTVLQIIGCDAKIRFDASKSDGTPRKLLDVCRIQAFGWKALTQLHVGIKMAYATAPFRP